MKFESIKALLRAGLAIFILLEIGKLLTPYLGLIFIACTILGVLIVLVFVVIFAMSR